MALVGDDPANKADAEGVYRKDEELEELLCVHHRKSR
jgi:hypothetical protein